MTLRHCKCVHIVVLVVPKRGEGVLRTPSSDAPHSLPDFNPGRKLCHLRTQNPSKFMYFLRIF